MNRALNFLANLFPLWVLLCSGLAMVRPQWFTWFGGNLIVWGLAVIMVGMGITLKLDDFTRVLKMPKPVLVGVAAQFVVMPMLGWTIARWMHLPSELAVGLILVSCCPGGTASNVVSYIAKADVALSVLMTLFSTVAAVVLTPVLTGLLAGSYVPVDVLGLLWNTVQVVVLPVATGIALNHLFPKLVRRIHPVAPLISVMFIALICASIIGSNASSIRESAIDLFLSVALLHLGGFSLGYVVGRVLGYSRLIRRTISIEVGMQNSGLGSVLAQRGFPGLPLAAVPSAISASFHSIIGSVLAAWWRSRVPNRERSLIRELQENEGSPA